MSELIQTKVVPAPAVLANPVERFFNQTPSDWDLVINEDGLVTANSPVSGETFEGTMADFNKAMRG
jgi:hypothetical protein